MRRKKQEKKKQIPKKYEGNSGARLNDQIASRVNLKSSTHIHTCIATPDERHSSGDVLWANVIGVINSVEKFHGHVILVIAFVPLFFARRCIIAGKPLKESY